MTGMARPLAGRQLTGLFAAEVISTTGTEMTAIALPWFVLVTTGSPTRMGAVLAADFVGMSLLGLWGGRVATIHGPWRMLLGCDLARAVLIAAVPVAYRLGVLSFPLLLGVGVAVGAFFPAYASSQRLVLAGLVGPDELRLTRASGAFGSVNETASFVGPAAGGLLVALIGAADVLVLDAVSYLCAFLLVALLVPAASGAPEPADEGTGVGAGLRHVVRDRVLLRRVAGLGLIGVGWAAMIGTLPVLALHRGGGPAAAGWLLGSYGAGSLVGGLVSARTRTLGGASLALAGIAVSTWLLLLPVPWWLLTGAVAANGVCSGLYYPRFFAALTSGTPPALRARVMTSVMIAMSAPSPLGFLGAGLLAQATGTTVPGVLLAAVAASLGAAVASGYLLIRRVA